MSGTAIISAAGWKGSGSKRGLADCPEPFLPLGDGTTTLSRVAMTFKKLDFDVYIGIARLGYPYKKYSYWRHPPLDDIGLSQNDSPWTQKWKDYAATLGTVIEVSDPGRAHNCDTFCVIMDHLGCQNWDRLILAPGDQLMSEGYLEAIMTALPWSSQYTFGPNHSYLLLNADGATFYREYVEPMRQYKSRIEWGKGSKYLPDGHHQGTTAMAKGGIPTYGGHNGPKGRWYDIDTPAGYAQALKMVTDGTFA